MVHLITEDNQIHLLKPDFIYCIGRRKTTELNFYCHESAELVHAAITLSQSGYVRLVAMLGKVYVNNVPIDTIKLTRALAVDDIINIRFGNSAAKLFMGDDKSIGIPKTKKFVVRVRNLNLRDYLKPKAHNDETNAVEQSTTKKFIVDSNMVKGAEAVYLYPASPYPSPDYCYPPDPYENNDDDDISTAEP